MTDPISDMLTRIRNAHRALLPTVVVPHSKMKESIASILQKEGYIADFAIEGSAFLDNQHTRGRLLPLDHQRRGRARERAADDHDIVFEPHGNQKMDFADRKRNQFRQATVSLASNFLADFVDSTEARPTINDFSECSLDFRGWNS